MFMSSNDDLRRIWPRPGYKRKPNARRPLGSDSLPVNMRSMAKFSRIIKLSRISVLSNRRVRLANKHRRVTQTIGYSILVGYRKNAYAAFKKMIASDSVFI